MHQKLYCSNLLPCQPVHTYATLSDFLCTFAKTCICWQQLCSGIDENAVGVCSQLVFAPVDATLSDNVPLLPSSFRVICLNGHLIVSTLFLCSFPLISFYSMFITQVAVGNVTHTSGQVQAKILCPNLTHSSRWAKPTNNCPSKNIKQTHRKVVAC